MKLLFDENLPRSLVDRLKDVFPDSNHVALLGLERATDSAIFQFATERSFVIVSKDSDFVELLSIHGEQPGLVWIRAGNCSTAAIETLLRNNHEQIEAMAEVENIKLLMLF